ncbi:bifunctional DNA primase/polymerase [Arthrobacter sp. ISL-85]|uniref:bifunctional DNA primase/polymerase n=1 Tax=Arthrobacter sp. ISL-85 TaxID=2819115 RepID=UPI001BEB7521|nr:bifunctional DNA primase/polymerase [Arthrobacter sp. ISL-85]MBT2566575.1 bifunctional DNA primase/polymerase [Arthrobacter sp. ISL-85]
MRAEKSPGGGSGAFHQQGGEPSVTPILPAGSSVYAEAFDLYRDAGWRGVLPIPARQKKPVPTGYTGRDGAWPSYSDVYDWAEQLPDGNIALRLPAGVIGIDVDHYEGKDGGGTLAALQDAHGPLPETWRTGSRADGVSGIRLYRVPEGLRWPGDLGNGIEVIQTRHRYAVVWPSVHPNGGTYRWTGPDGVTRASGVPAPADLAPLPPAWVKALTGGHREQDVTAASLDGAAVNAWLAGHGAGETCRRMAHAAQGYAAALAFGQRSRHDAAMDAAMGICHLAAEGHIGALEALGAVRSAFLDAVAGDRTPEEAAAEWDRLQDGAVAIAAAGTAASVDPCADPLTQLDGLIMPEDRPAALAAPVVAPSAMAAAEVALAAPVEAVDNYSRAVAERLLQLRVQDDAARMFRQQRDGGTGAKPELVKLAALLDEPDESEDYRVDALWPTGGRVVLAAQYKAGKSTAVGNVLRSLADGADLFGRYRTGQAARVVLIDNELHRKTLRRWLRGQGIGNVDAVELVPLRGRVSEFDILDPSVRAEWVRLIQGADVVVLDCLRPVLDALGLSEDKDAGRFLVAFDALLEAAGVGEAMVVHHMGHNGERSRGDSRILDWPDATWKIVKQDQDNPSGPRYFSAFGRDVDVPEAGLAFDETTRHLTLTEATRKEAKAEEALPAVLSALTGVNALSGRQVEEALKDSGHTRRQIQEALILAHNRKLLVKYEGARRAIMHSLTPSAPSAP